MDEGSREAFLEQVRPQRSRMIRVISRLLRNADDAEDAFQDALLLAWRKFKQIRSHPRPDLLLLRIGADSARERLRKRNRCRSREQRLDTVEEVVDYDASPREASEREEQERRLIEQIARLPRQQSLAVVLRFVEERSLAEVATILECSESTARSHVSRAVRRLRAKLSDTF